MSQNREQSEIYMLVRCIWEGLGRYLGQVEGREALTMIEPQLKLVPVHDVAPLPAPPVPPEVESEVSDDDARAESDAAPPAPQDVIDPNFPRERLETFLLTKGYAEKAVKAMSRPVLNQAVLKTLDGQVKRGRGRPAKSAPPAPPPTETADEALAKMSTAEITALAKFCQVDPGSPTVVASLAAILVTASAAREILARVQDTTPEEPVAYAVAASAPLPSPAPVVTPPPTPETTPEVAPPPAAMPEAPAPTETPVVDLPSAAAVVPDPAQPSAKTQAFLEYLRGKYGYQGELLTYAYKNMGGGEIDECLPAFAAMIKQDAADLTTQVPAYVKRMGCAGDCKNCPRGGAQLVTCMATHDTEYEGFTLDDVLSGGLVLLFARTGRGLREPPATIEAAKAVIEEIH